MLYWYSCPLTLFNRSVSESDADKMFSSAFTYIRQFCAGLTSCMWAQNMQLIGGSYVVWHILYFSTRAEMIIYTNQLVGYQNTSRCQYYEIGYLFSCVYHHMADYRRSLELWVSRVKTLKRIKLKHFICILFLKYQNITLLANLLNSLVNSLLQHLMIRHFVYIRNTHVFGISHTC